jgi:hypothetical protein
MGRTSMSGGQNTSALLVMPSVASSTYAALLETITASGKTLQAAVGELVTFAFGANYEVDRAANNGIPMGRVVALERRSATDWLVSVEMLRVTPSGTNAKPFRPIAIVQLPYRSGATVTLGKPVIVDQTTASTYDEADDSGADADGLGCIIAKDTTALTIDVLV